jgi:hypothetical protein
MVAIAISYLSRWTFGSIIQRRQGPAFAVACPDPYGR